MNLRIGLETHVQLSSKTKLFCGCRNPLNLEKEPEPNTLVCPTCLGHPGSKPRVNKKVIELAKRVALALNFKISERMFFSRKTYFYPDMCKNFQITQYEIPLGKNGCLWIETKEGRKKIRLRRIHIEEDPAKIIHIGGIGGKYVLVDYNRAGIPLLEIVTEPDFTSPEEARIFLQKLSLILEYLGVYEPGKGIFKSDANISLERNERVEVKNITGTKEIEQALKYEVLRQETLLRKGIQIKKETRMWNPELGVTQEMRIKEEEEEYGYIFEPDLTVIEISNESLEKIRETLPELPEEKYRRFIEEFGLPEKVSEALVSDPEMAELFEEISKKIPSKIAGSWIAGYLKKTLNWHGLRFKDSGIRKEWITELLEYFINGKITDRTGEMVIRKMIEIKKPPKEIIDKEGLWKESRGLEEVVKKILTENPKPVEDYIGGEEKALHFLVGLCMKDTRGKFDAKEIREVILKLINNFKPENKG